MVKELCALMRQINCSCSAAVVTRSHLNCVRFGLDVHQPDVSDVFVFFFLFFLLASRDRDREAALTAPSSSGRLAVQVWPVAPPSHPPLENYFFFFFESVFNIALDFGSLISLFLSSCCC